MVRELPCNLIPPSASQTLDLLLVSEQRGLLKLLTASSATIFGATAFPSSSSTPAQNRRFEPSPADSANFSEEDPAFFTTSLGFS